MNEFPESPKPPLENAVTTPRSGHRHPRTALELVQLAQEMRRAAEREEEAASGAAPAEPFADSNDG